MVSWMAAKQIALSFYSRRKRGKLCVHTAREAGTGIDCPNRKQSVS
jgi:hypothetical protein